MDDYEKRPLPPLAARNKYGVSESITIRIQPALAADMDGFIGIDGYKSRSEFIRNAAIHFLEQLRMNGLKGNEVARLRLELETKEEERAACQALEQKAIDLICQSNSREEKEAALEFARRVVVAIEDDGYSPLRLLGYVESS